MKLSDFNKGIITIWSKKIDCILFYKAFHFRGLITDKKHYIQNIKSFINEDDAIDYIQSIKPDVGFNAVVELIMVPCQEFNEFEDIDIENIDIDNIIYIDTVWEDDADEDIDEDNTKMYFIDTDEPIIKTLHYN